MEANERLKRPDGESVQLTPSWYASFHCIAGACPQTCCQEWKIAVDADTLRRWKTVPCPDNPHKRLDSLTCRKEGSRVIRLNEKHLCPLLTGEKLCRLVLEHGEGMLSRTCQVFPREEHGFPHHSEKTLMPSCPEVLKGMQAALTAGRDEISGKAGIWVWWKREDWEQAFSRESGALQRADSVRRFLMEGMADESLSPEAAFQILFYVLLELRGREQDGSFSAGLLAEWEENGSLQALREQVLSAGQDLSAGLAERNELLLDMTANYREQGMYRDTLEKLIRWAEAAADGESDGRPGKASGSAWAAYRDFLRQKAALDPFLRLLLMEEIWAECLDEEGDLTHMILKFEWLALEYAVICQALFLYFCHQGELREELVSRLVVTVFRMTGYDDEDIEAYLEDCFDRPVWDWGYMALLQPLADRL